MDMADGGTGRSLTGWQEPRPMPGIFITHQSRVQSLCFYRQTPQAEVIAAVTAMNTVGLYRAALHTPEEQTAKRTLCQDSSCVVDGDGEGGRLAASLG